MKRPLLFIIALLLSLLLGWVLGYLRLPYLESHLDFGIGFMACLGMVALTWVLLTLWQQNTLIFQSLQKAPPQDQSQKSFSLLWLLIASVVLIGSLASGFLIYRQNQFYQQELQAQTIQEGYQLELTQAARRSDATALMSSLFEKIDQELAHSPDRRLSQATIDRVAALSYSFEPTHNWEDGAFSEKKFSKERGLLLLVLSKIEMDSSSFVQLKQQTDFSGADLAKADLADTDLSMIDLSHANLRDANLTGATLDSAIFMGVDLHGSIMSQSHGSGIVFENAQLTWAECDSAQFLGSDFNGTVMKSGKFRQVDFSGSGFEWALLNEGFFNGANFAGTDLEGTDFGRTNLTQANFTKADLKLANFSEAIMEQTDLTDVKIDRTTTDVANWFEKLKAWKAIGVEEIEATQEILEDYAKEQNYRLKKKE